MEWIECQRKYICLDSKHCDECVCHDVIKKMVLIVVLFLKLRGGRREIRRVMKCG